jgi:hypothetical protein
MGEERRWSMYMFPPTLHIEAAQREFLMLMKMNAMLAQSMIESSIRITLLLLWSPNIMPGPKTP